MAHLERLLHTVTECEVQRVLTHDTDRSDTRLHRERTVMGGVDQQIHVGHVGVTDQNLSADTQRSEDLRTILDRTGSLPRSTTREDTVTEGEQLLILHHLIAGGHDAEGVVQPIERVGTDHLEHVLRHATLTLQKFQPHVPVGQVCEPKHLGSGEFTFEDSSEVVPRGLQTRSERDLATGTDFETVHFCSNDWRIYY
ncbi:hypothetical protein SEA_TOMSAWYER_268 [Streptomyces phage TomSawyer]|nr:hypothetical protein SEA_TOMSAWYER_3 [Streptomyces phage TomSawyer]QGH79110.1 hypothetical protein SEA_TOMSAWYER_268 [Streptomyces phage TomSawyer]